MKLIDTYLHVRWSDDRDLLPYLPETWHSRWLHGNGHTDAGLLIRPKYYDPSAHGCKSAAGAGASAAVVRRDSDAAVQVLCKTLIDEAVDFSSGPLTDDVTVLAVRRS